MYISPLYAEIGLASLAAVILLADLCVKESSRLSGLIFTAGTLVLLAAVFFTGPLPASLFGGAYVSDGLAWFGKLLVLGASALTGLMSLGSLKTDEKYSSAYYTLLACSALGLMFLVSSKELVTLYVGLELATISLYALTAYNRDDFALEAGLKYLILGAAASAVLLYGLGFLYALSGGTSLDALRLYASGARVSPLFPIAVILTLLGAGFKLSMVPMHSWTPDVYQGARAPVAAFISVASKAAAFIFAIRLFHFAFAGKAALWQPAVGVLAFITMTVGNLVAISQKDIKRLLAYSTISQAGYILVGFAGAPAAAVSSVLFYLLVYTLTNLLAFAAVAAFSRVTGSDKIADYAGLSRRSPLLALALLTALLSLAGIPPLAGFAGKFYLFYAAMGRGLVWLVLAAALNSTVSLYYYLLILRKMYIDEPPAGALPVPVPLSLKITMAVCAAGILIAGVFPGPVISFTSAAARALLN